MNIAAASDSQNASSGRRFSSAMSESATAKSRLKTTICSTWPSATAFATFSGNALSTTSASDCGGGRVPEGCIASGAWSPAPACDRLIAARPMKSASVVTTSK